MAAMDWTWATGRRKEATAQVRIRPGSGRIIVNNTEYAEYFTTDGLRGFIEQPLQVTNSMEKYDIAVTVKGGGLMGQAGAIRHGLARTLIAVEPGHRGVLKESGMLTRDARVKERKKPGQPGARKRFQFSKR
jgi:small subunit ribosomal protein S9